MDSNHDVQCYVKSVLQEQHLENISVEISSGVNGEGLMGDIVFAKVTGTSTNKSKEEYHLVLKFGKKNEHLRKIMPVREVYELEIYMYSMVFPIWQKFRKENGLEESNIIPKCYRTFDGQGSEVIVLQNLRPSGYTLHDKFTPMNMDHMRIVLKAYGEWHAFSFAFQDQNGNEYDRVTSSLKNILYEFMKKGDLKSVLESGAGRVRQVLTEHGDHDLLRKFNKITEKGDTNDYFEMVCAKPDKTIISHGDCWNGNFLFKYGENTGIPEKVTLIDWQTSFPRSPVFDLSNFIYSVGSKKVFDQMDTLLDIYYNSLSDNIRILESDPAKLFSREELLDHWGKYSLYGFITGAFFMQFTMCELEDIPSLGDLTTDQNFGSVATGLNIKKNHGYYKRIRDIVEHYTSYNDV